MVIEVFVEGDKKLRQGFSALLGQKVKRRLQINMQGNDVSAVKGFMNPQVSTNKLLLVDLDMPTANKNERLQYLKIEKESGRVYFMVQKMEAWFLSQPEVINQRFNMDVSDKIKRKAWEIENPDRFLKDLVSSKRNYHKIDDALPMLLSLNVDKLAEDFEDVNNLINTLSKA